MMHRMLSAILALVGFFVALYLSLWKLGFMGPLLCTPGGGCEVVQTSEYAVFLGVPVAFYGVGGFAAIFAVSLVGVQPAWRDRREPTVLLVLLAGTGVAFSAYLTYLEAAVIGAWCQWCIASAVIVTATFLASVTGLLRWRAPVPVAAVSSRPPRTSA